MSGNSSIIPQSDSPQGRDDVPIEDAPRFSRVKLDICLAELTHDSPGEGRSIEPSRC